MTEPGWLPDPANPGFERWHDGARWTERSRVSQARPVGRSGTGLPTLTRAVWIVFALVATGVVAYFAWVAVSRAQAVTEEMSGFATNAPTSAQLTSLSSDVGALQIAVTTLGVENPSELPAVAMGDGEIVVSSGGTSQTVPVSDAVVAAGIDGTANAGQCVWVRAEDGTTMHATPTSSPALGGC